MSGGNSKINLILGSHAHVPPGAAEYEFRDAYEKVMRPFVSTLYKYPKIHAVLHYSGALLYWVERSHPELFMLIEDMVSRKQAELLGGGFYDPMLPLIPPQDRIGQIELLTTYLRKHFGKRPQGCWIPVLAWEQHLVSPLAACGMSYTFLGEKQFLMAGFTTEDLFRPCVSEDQGKLITVFPVFQSAESSLAEKNISIVLEELKALPSLDGERIVSIFPAKLGAVKEESPDYTWNRFFEELSLSESAVECVTPGKLLKRLKNLKRAVFSDSTGLISGDERVTPRRFIIEHPETNGVYAKMIFTSVLINQLRGDKSRKLGAREELWKAQSCDLFYSPPEGEICRHSLRKAAYRSLLDAERITREKEKFSPSLVRFDFDFDGFEEYLFQDVKLNCYVQLTGAGVFELDYLPKTWNYLDAGAAENGRRTAFADRLLPEVPESGDSREAAPGGGARLCFNEQYEPLSYDRSKARICFGLPALPDPTLPFGNIGLEKCFFLKKDILTVHYSIVNRGRKTEAFRFVSEINLSFAGEGEEYVRLFVSNAGEMLLDGASGAPINGATGLKIQDLKNETQINLGSTKPFNGSLSTARIGEQYQAHRIMPHFDLSLGSGETWTNEFSLRFSH
jgi:hypothetical protein